MSGMKARTIKKILKSKLDDWISSIDDAEVASAVKQNTIVTGGSISSMLLGEPIKDYDLYFKDYETTKKVAIYYVNKFNNLLPPKEGDVKRITPIVQCADKRVRIHIQSAGVAALEQKKDYKYFEIDDPNGTEAEDFFDGLMDEKEEASKAPYRPVFLSANAITLSNKVQVVIRFYGEPDKIHENYDFVHCCNWYDYGKHHLEFNKEALASLLSKTLYYQGSLYPVCSIFRIRKFMERGWKVSAGELLKIVWQISYLDLNNFEVLEEQLTGVDAAYFHEVLQIVKDAKEKGKTLDSTYIATIVDRVFNL
jgi:hypothetical protein